MPKVPDIYLSKMRDALKGTFRKKYTAWAMVPGLSLQISRGSTTLLEAHSVTGMKTNEHRDLTFTSLGLLHKMSRK